MLLKIELKNKIVALALMEKSRTLDHFSWEENNRLSSVILQYVDNFLKKNGVEKNKLEKITFRSDVDKNFTSVRIIATFVKSFNFFLQKNTSVSKLNK